MKYFVYWQYRLLAHGTPSASLKEFDTLPEAVAFCEQLLDDYDSPQNVRVISGRDLTASLSAGNMR